MKIISKLAVFSMMFLLIGCSSQSMKGVSQAVTGSASPQELAPVELKSDPITIIIPGKSYKTVAEAFNDIRFSGFRNGGKGVYQQLRITEKSDSLRIERRVDNGSVGSGIIYTANAKVEARESDSVLTLQLTNASKYQQGLFGKFAIPSFSEANAKNVISTPTIDFQFDIDSEFDKASVDANFSRLAKVSKVINRQTMTRYYELDNNGTEVLYIPKSYPYRGGTKVTFDIKLTGSLNSNNVVDFRNDLEKVKQALSEIVDS